MQFLLSRSCYQLNQQAVFNKKGVVELVDVQIADSSPMELVELRIFEVQQVP